jgi:general secretion pathway protein A
MYRAYFHLVYRPFEISPDPSFFCATDQHVEALAGLAYGIKTGKGIMVLTGEVGTGKTLVARCVEELPGTNRIAYAHVFNPRLSSQQFLAYVAEDLGLSPRPTAKGDLLMGLSRLLTENRRQGITTVLVVEEAQHLGAVVLEEIRLLTNLESPQGKLLQILLIGQPELETTLDSARLRQLKQRITLWFRLRPLSIEETTTYVEHRLKLAGKNGREIFAPEALERVYRYSHGTPRLINILCDNAMMSAFALRQERITHELIDEAASDLALETLTGNSDSTSAEAATPSREASGENPISFAVVVKAVQRQINTSPDPDALAKEERQ